MSNQNSPLPTGADQIIRTLNPQFLPLFFSHLDAAGQVLKNYLGELVAVEGRMNKHTSDPAIRKAMGGDELRAKKTLLTETLSKLEAHKLNSLRRLNG